MNFFSLKTLKKTNDFSVFKKLIINQFTIFLYDAISSLFSTSSEELLSTAPNHHSHFYELYLCGSSFHSHGIPSIKIQLICWPNQALIQEKKLRKGSRCSRLQSYQQAWKAFPFWLEYHRRCYWICIFWKIIVLRAALWTSAGDNRWNESLSEVIASQS